MTSPVENFAKDGIHVLELLKLHKEKNVDKKTHHAYEILTKSCIVLIVACWEAFIEDMAEAAVEYLVEKVESPNMLPSALLKSISDELKNDKNELKVWSLAGDGWRDVLRNHFRAMLSKHLGPFNTPKAGNIDALYKAVLGLDRFSSCWSWQGMSNKCAKDKLSELVTLRGEIAHRVNASRKVTNKLADRYALHLVHLAIQSSNQIRLHLHATTGEYPWDEEEW